MELFTATDAKTSNATPMLIVNRANNCTLTVLGPQLLPLPASLEFCGTVHFSGNVVSHIACYSQLFLYINILFVC
jgi:hypothetical protein